MKENTFKEPEIKEEPEEIKEQRKSPQRMRMVKDNVNNTSINIEHDSINIFVKKFNTNKYIEFIETDSVFNEDSAAYVFEKRLNENGFYDLKFGNGVNGVRLDAGDQIYIYYLKSKGEAGKVSAGNLDGNNLNIFTTLDLRHIFSDSAWFPAAVFPDRQPRHSRCQIR